MTDTYYVSLLTRLRIAKLAARPHTSMEPYPPPLRGMRMVECCGGAEARGHPCVYHRGMEDGIDNVLRLLGIDLEDSE